MTPQTPMQNDLMTSSPIMNRTKQGQNIKEVDQEKDKLNTFQTPMPQAHSRFNRQMHLQQLKFGQGGNASGVDSRLQQLVGIGPVNPKGKNTVNLESIQEQEKESKREHLKQLAGFSNNLTHKVNQLSQNQNQTQPGDKSIASMIQNGFMTPAVNKNSQFS